MMVKNSDPLMEIYIAFLKGGCEVRRPCEPVWGERLKVWLIPGLIYFQGEVGRSGDQKKADSKIDGREITFLR